MNSFFMQSTPPFRAYPADTFDQLADAVAKEFLAAPNRIRANNDMNEVCYFKG